MTKNGQKLTKICTFLGMRWCRIAMCWRWCRRAMWPCALHPTCVDDLSSIPDGCGKIPQWVTWHGWQYQAVTHSGWQYQAIQDPTYMTKGGAVEQCDRVRVALHCIPPAWMTSAVYQMSGGRVPSGWHGVMTVPSRHPLMMTVPSRPGSNLHDERWCRRGMWPCLSALTLHPTWVDDLSSIPDF